MITLPVKQWIQRQQENYRQATGEYVARLREILNKQTKARCRELKSMRLLVRLDNSNSNNNNNAHKKQRNLRGITVARASLPEARINDRVRLVPCKGAAAAAADQQQVKLGLVSRITLTEIRIKFDKPLRIMANDKQVEETKKKDGEECNTGGQEYAIVFDTRETLERRERIENSLCKFERLSCSLPIHKCILGNYEDRSNLKYSKARVFCLDGITNLRLLQAAAVEQSMKKRISLVEGLAGSGKTLVAANIACSMARLRKRKVLICSPIQSTVNRLAQMIGEAENVFAVQLTSSTEVKHLHTRSRLIEFGDDDFNIDDDFDCSLDKLTQEALYRRAKKRLNRVMPRINSLAAESRSHERAKRMVKNSATWLKEHTERKIVLRADVVCCTLAQVGSPKLKGIRFDMLIIDDAHLATELDCLVAMVTTRVKQVTLLGDVRRELRLARATKNLPKESMSTKLRQDSSLKLSSLRRAKSRRDAKLLEERNRLHRDPGGLFERWLSLGVAPVALKHQYRMHESLAAFPNHHFYLSRLKTDPIINAQLTSQIYADLITGDDAFSWLPNSRCLTALFSVDTLNEDICSKASEIIDNLVLQGIVDHNRIGIITNLYSEVGHSLNGVQVKTIEDFFGQERDFIILLSLVSKQTDSVRSSSDLEINFLENDNALNTALTRARLGLFIVADRFSVSGESAPEPAESDEIHKSTFVKCTSWRELVKYYAANQLIR